MSQKEKSPTGKGDDEPVLVTKAPSITKEALVEQEKLALATEREAREQELLEIQMAESVARYEAELEELGRLKHKTNVSVTVFHTELVNQLADLRYDALSSIISQLATRILVDSEKDWERKREQLAVQLQLTADSLAKCSKYLDNAWAICKPKMGVP